MWYGQPWWKMINRVKSWLLILTLCSIPTCLIILNKAWPSCSPLWALLSHVKPIRALLSSHFAGINFLIQCAVTAKYPSVLLACQALHIKLTLPWMVGPCKVIREEQTVQVKTYIYLGFQFSKMILEQMLHLTPGCLPTWNLNIIFCMRSKLNQLLELWVLESMNGL